MTRCVRDTIIALGFEVHLNRPYAGGYITEHYGRPGAGVHAIQLEVNRGLYLNEMTLTKTAGFAPLVRDLRNLTLRLFADLPTVLGRRLAAE
jgi:N-formylglutamate amidohydrolase